ncbi:hypothetical protein HF086_006584 [Spodoptera exigua]|uniref:Cadherin domain-containing protein n=1 Tax=Spodoptera exigua TaxID=7107 RepID=A0A922SC46_SPOEX|nr:hypothetical protein HF086_006584 [Spodoptera exigua]
MNISTSERSSIPQVKAYDDDPGEYGTVTYSIPSARLRETFAIDASSGALSTRVALDRERRAEWEVGVAASDAGGLLAHTVVRVRVADANDNAPEFPLREYRAAVRADRAPRLPFLTLAARDADAGDHARLHYSVYEGDARSDTAGLFAIDAHTGALSFARDATPYDIINELWIVVFVLGARDVAPRLLAPPPDLFLREDAAPGTLVADLGPPGAAPPRYRLAPALWPRDLFAIDDAGRLVLAAPLDRETAAEHIIGIIAEGPGSPAPAVMVQTRLHVLDVNEHAPSFHSQPYVVHIAENTPPHSSIVQCNHFFHNLPPFLLCVTGCPMVLGHCAPST